MFKPFVLLVIVCSAYFLPQDALALVNVNSAPKSELVKITQISDGTAEKILDHIATNGAITDLATLCSLRGVGLTTATCQTIGAEVYFGPVEVLESGKDTDTGVTTSNSRSSNSVGSESSRDSTPPMSGLTLDIPEVAYVGELVRFAVGPSDGRSRQVRYRWNFGDGHTDFLRYSTHRYSHAGTYLVTVEGRYEGDSFLMRHELKVLPLELSIEIVTPSSVRIHNKGEYELDLSNMTLIGVEEFVFANHTVILPGQGITIKVPAAGSVSLKDTEGVVLAVGGVRATEPPPRSITRSTTATTKSAITPVAPEAEVEEEDVSGGTGEARATSSSMVGAVSNSRVSEEAWPYLGLFALVAFGLVSIYVTPRPN